MISQSSENRPRKPALPPEASDYGRDRAEPVGEVVRRWAKRSGFTRVSDRDKIWDVWQRLLGPEAAHTSIERLANRGPSAGVLTIVVDSSALLSELRNFRKEELLETLRREVKTYFVQDLKFRLEKKPPPKPGRR
ncbi:MAG: DUF721 domain-containing protein [Planctomycetota bacterium]|nr:DUF721 domain-containing protein [Planctomycetota bacterium]